MLRRKWVGRKRGREIGSERERGIWINFKWREGVIMSDYLGWEIYYIKMSGWVREMVFRNIWETIEI